MNILVCVKQVPLPGDVRMDENHSLIREGVPHQMNPADEAALEAALRMKGAGSVTVMTMGKPSAQAMLLECVSRGADRMAHVCDTAFAGADTYATARTLAAAAAYTGPYDLVLCGRRAIDGETGQVPPELAAFLGWPVVANVTEVSIADDRLRLSRLLEDRTETLLCPLPAVVSLCEYTYPLRLPAIAGLRKARQSSVLLLTQKELQLAPEDCGLRGSPTRVKEAGSHTLGVRNAIFANSIPEGASLAAAWLLESGGSL